jgi:hypothetical protein
MLKRMVTVLAVIALGAFLVSVPAFAQGHGKGKEKEQQRAERDDSGRHEDDDARAPAHKGQPVFSTRDRDLIRDYFRGRNSNLPPGLAKRGGNLPPGLQRQLERNGTLPPGLQKRLTPFPADLSGRLPRLPDIYRRGTIGPDAIIIDTRTQRIIDIVRAVVNP